MAATTERRKSFSQFFGFNKAEPKQEPAPDYPKLRRKLQKVTKQIDADADYAPSGHVTAPAPDGGIETVKMPGDDSFVSTKYETRPVSSYGGVNNSAANNKEEKRSRRESRTRFFSRSSSTSRAPNASRSASCNRASSVAPRPGSSRVEDRPRTSAAPVPPVPSNLLTKAPVSAPVSSPSADNTKLAAQEKEKEAKVAQNARQARALELLDAHERAAAQEWTGKNRSSLSFGPAEPKKSPSTTPRKQELTPPPSRDQAHVQTDERPLTRPFTQFHLPYKHAQSSSISSAPMIDDAIEARYFANRSPYPARQFVPAAMSIPIKHSAHGPFTPGHSHSGSNASSASISSPMSATFSACLSFTSASSVNPSCSTLPYSAPSVASSCVGSPDDVHSGPFGYSREHGRNYSQDSNGDNRVVPELSYLSRGRSHTSHIPDSPASVISNESSSTKPRRKKTPVYAIGQLEGNSSSDEASSNEGKYVSKKDHVALNIQTPPDSPVFAATALDNGQTELDLLQSKSSIECIAEEYRALLASRGSQHTDAQSEVNVDVVQRATPSLRVRNGTKHASHHTQPPSKSPAPRKFLLSPGPEKATPQMVHTDSYWDLRAMPGAMPASPPMTKMTPPLPLRTRSSIYGNNPVSKTPVSANKAAAKPKSPQPDNLSLQICVDLLARELSSAVTHRSSAAAATAASQRAATRRNLQHNLAGGIRDPRTLISPKSAPPVAPPAIDSAGSALQILVMIEAYERLRDQLVEDARRRRQGSRSNAEVEQIEAMFGMWLKSLYQIHDSLTCSSDEDGSDGLDHTSESEYDSA
ncbi:mating-type switching protein swi10-like protein [Ophiostoma piceae UAMH 11346]|uniref:Mating-type switching protein swi10-like protein n=1 Tax=Ophiostoma piceae (strain UAMH 11346) TaxID=1262450 RepID=S3C807_OPHP1|nr:mating-type switching protein swi10-like protein [Ophiostoma piceae UAMH 11346]